VIVPKTYAVSKRARVLWAVKTFLDAHTAVGPFAHHGRERVHKAMGRRQDIWEHKVADRLSDYFQEERVHAVNAAENGGDPELAVRGLEADMHEVLLGSLTDVAQAHYDWVRSHVKTKAKAAPDALDRDVYRYLQVQATRKVKEINQTTRKKLRDILAAATREGETVKQAAKRIDRLYLDEIIPNRSFVIARTEIGAAANYAGLAAARDTSLRMRKEWNTNVDGRERDTHRAVDGQVVNLDDDFQVGGEALGFPGDPRGSAENVIQCRCFLTYVTR
jgi:hypothetical protein